MEKLKPCIFCGSTEPVIVEEIELKKKCFYVQCDHCAARGSHFVSAAMISGDFDETNSELAERAVRSWNTAGHPTWWQRNVKRRYTQLEYDILSYYYKIKHWDF